MLARQIRLTSHAGAWAITLVLLTSAATAGPISKFDSKKPDFEGVSQVALFDLERCLTDMDGWPVPYIYRQPDRPNEINMLWVVTNGSTAARAHLVKSEIGVTIRIWNAAGNQARSCVATGRPQ